MEDHAKQEYLVLFGEGLRALRTSAGLTQEELAERAGVDRSYLGGIERGEHNLALINIIKIANSLSLQPHELLLPLTIKQANQ
jgi:transcriptional regulator with XRE-family HTH domain